VVGRKVAAAVDAMADLIADLDADLVGGRDSVDLVAEWSRLEHLAAAALMSSADRPVEARWPPLRWALALPRHGPQRR
jgi:hypothetical protein